MLNDLLGASETICEHSCSLSKIRLVHVRDLVLASSDNYVEDVFNDHFGAMKICSKSRVGFLIADI